jgi:hypothetical protein
VSPFKQVNERMDAAREKLEEVRDNMRRLRGKS